MRKLIYLAGFAAISTISCAKQLPTLVNYAASNTPRCELDYMDVNFCDSDHMNVFKKAIKETPPNFYKNYILITYPENNKERSLFVIDTKTKVVYPLDFLYYGYVNKIGNSANKAAILDFNKDSNKFCIDGSVQAYKYQKENQRTCFLFKNESKKYYSFEKINGEVRTNSDKKISKNSLEYSTKNPTQTERKKYIIDGISISKLPYKPFNHIACIMDSNKNLCQNDIKLVDPIEISKRFPSLSPQYGKSVILPVTDDGTKVIISPFTDEGEQLVFFLTTINQAGTPHEYTFYSNTTFDIDKNYKLRMYDKTGKIIKTQKIINGELK